MPSDLLQPLIDPTAPLPAYWPTGFWGAFLLFLVPIGGGIPLGVLMARDAGVSPLVMSGMYFVSDIFMAITHEPFFMLLGWLASIIPTLGKVRDFFAKASGQAGLKDEGAHGPLGLILFSFTVDPVSGRGAAAAAGHGFITGWALAIAGDMIYFAVLMGATLWLAGMFGDERTTVGVVLIAVWGLSWLIRRKRVQNRAGFRPSPVAVASQPTARPALAPLTADQQPAATPLPRGASIARTGAARSQPRRKKSAGKRRPR